MVADGSGVKGGVEPCGEAAGRTGEELSGGVEFGSTPTVGAELSDEDIIGNSEVGSSAADETD